MLSPRRRPKADAQRAGRRRRQRPEGPYGRSAPAGGVRHGARRRRLGAALSRAACGDRPSCSAEPRAGTEDQEAAAALPPRGRCGRPVRAPSCPVPGTLRSGGRLSPGTSPPYRLTSYPPVEACGSSSAPTLKVSPSLGCARQSFCPSARRDPDGARSAAGLPSYS